MLTHTYIGGFVPIVTIVVAQRVIHRHRLFLAAREIIPAGLHCGGSEDGKLQPGNIELRFHDLVNADYGSVDVLVDINAVGYIERQVDIDRRTSGMRDSFEELFPDYRFAVAVSFGLASWSSSDPDDTTPHVEDMSMDAAVTRARLAVKEAAALEADADTAS